MDIYTLFEVSEKLRLDANEALVFLNVIIRLNRKFWQPVAIKQDVAGRGMRRKTFFSARKRLVDMGALTYRPGLWKTAPPLYGLGPRFNDDKEYAKTEKEMRDKKAIRELVIEIDLQYPDFSELCAAHKWDKAIEVMKARHPELAVSEWPVDSIGDPKNRKEAYEMMVKLHERKNGTGTMALASAPVPDVWADFYLFVDLWRLTYPKKAGRALIMKTVKDFIKGKKQWTHEQVKALEETITAHTTSYVASFAGEFTYMVSPVNYFAAEKWTEKVSVKRDKTDVNSKTAGAHAITNMPKIRTIKAN